MDTESEPEKRDQMYMTEAAAPSTETSPTHSTRAQSPGRKRERAPELEHPPDLEQQRAAPGPEGPPPEGELSMREDAEVSGLPRLNYNPLNHKWKLYPVVFLLVLESSLLPIALFYGLWYGTTLRHGILFAIITAFFGLVTGLEFGFRCLKLIHVKDTYRPVDGTRWRFDFTHWTLAVAYTIMTALLIAASVPHEPLVRPLALPVSYFLIQVGGELIWSGFMNKMGKKAPCKISSVAKGERMPPLVLTIVEDIIGVDGGAGQSYRRRLLARYEASEAFRDMIVKMNWFWGIGAVLDGVATVVVIWTVPQEIAYGVGWVSPLVFVCIWVLVTVYWVRGCLRREKQLWGESH